MKTVTVPALKAFTYRGRSYRRGDLVVMVPVDAAVAARIGDVSLTRGYRPAALTPAPPPAEPEPPAPRRRRRARDTSPDESGTYRRRDLVAEDPE